MLDYLSSFTIAFSLRPVGDIGTVFRRYPGQWKVGCSEQSCSIVLGGLSFTSLPTASHKQCIALHREYESANYPVLSGVQHGGNCCCRCSLRTLRCQADLHWPLSGMSAPQVLPQIVPRYSAVCPFSLRNIQEAIARINSTLRKPCTQDSALMTKHHETAATVPSCVCETAVPQRDTCISLDTSMG